MVKLDKTIELQIENNIEKPFLKPVKKQRDLNFYNEQMSKLWYAPGGSLSKMDWKKKKLMAFGFFVQKEPCVVRDWGNNTRCILCEHVFMETASVKWLDRKKDGSVRPFHLSAVCPSCLTQCGVKWVYDYVIVKDMLSHRSDLRFRHMHDAPDHSCMICYKNDGDSTFVNVPVQNLLLEVPVCDKHLEALCTVSHDKEMNDLEIPDRMAQMIKAFNDSQEGGFFGF